MIKQKPAQLQKDWCWRKNPHQNRDRIVYDWVLIDGSTCPVEKLAVVHRPPCLWQGWSVYVGDSIYPSKFKTLRVAKAFAIHAARAGIRRRQS